MFSVYRLFHVELHKGEERWILSCKTGAKEKPWKSEDFQGF